MGHKDPLQCAHIPGKLIKVHTIEPIFSKINFNILIPSAPVYLNDLVL